MPLPSKAPATLDFSLADKRQFVSELARVCAPGGRIIIVRRGAVMFSPPDV